MKVGPGQSKAPTWNNKANSPAENAILMCGKAPKTPSRSLVWFGGYSTSKTPDPIPNSAVKCRRANGTASQDVGE